MNLKYILIIVILAAFVGGGIFTYQYWLAPKEEIKPPEVKPSEEVVTDETANWKTYTYKDLSFKYPEDWTVVFDSEVWGQPNGFSLHVMKTGDGGFQPDELGLSTYNDRSDTPSDYILSTNRIFSLNQSGDSYIKFVTNGTTIFAGCGYYSKGTATLDVCNKIVSTVETK